MLDEVENQPALSNGIKQQFVDVILLLNKALLSMLFFKKCPLTSFIRKLPYLKHKIKLIFNALMLARLIELLAGRVLQMYDCI